MEQKIRHGVAEVRRALAGLVAEGLMVERRAADGAVRYGLNAARLDEVRHRVEESQR